MSQLFLSLFGRFRATLDGEPIKITSQKSHALLAWLALHPNSAQSRETLAVLLWPEHDGKSASGNLRKTLSRLRKQLPEFLTVTSKTVQLRVESSWQADVVLFQEAVKSNELLAASKLYTGDFLTGLEVDSAEFQDWFILKREYLRREYLFALSNLTKEAFRANNYHSALSIGRRRVELDQFDEDAHCDIMRALALDGQTEAALTHFEQLKMRLMADLDVEPSAQTVELKGKIESNALVEKSAEKRSPKGKPKHNLPIQHTEFVGRQATLASLSERLANPNQRWLTLLGMGGIGKTRLSIELGKRQAENFADGVWFVPLASLPGGAAEDEIVQLIASTVGIDFPQSAIRAELRRDHLLDQLRDRNLLLILDNFEHLTSRVEIVASLLKWTERLNLIVTSREALHLDNETVINVEGLAYPPAETTPESAQSDCDAAVLFTLLAKRVVASFQPTPDVGRIARLVRGSPLALELAATAIRRFSAETIADKIEANIDFLASTQRDVDERHRSIRAVFNYSWALLNDSEREAFASLAVFAGRFSADAAVQVGAVSAELLTLFVDRSLLQPAGELHYVMHPLIVQYAREKATDDPERMVRIRSQHADYFLGLIGKMDLFQFGGLQDPDVRFMSENIENIRLSWRTALEERRKQFFGEAIFNFSTYGFISGLWQRDLEAMLDAVIEVHSAEAAHDIDSLILIAICEICISRIELNREQTDRALALAKRGHGRLVAVVDHSDLALFALLFGIDTVAVAHIHRRELELARGELDQMLLLAETYQLKVMQGLARNDLGGVCSITGEYRLGLDYFLSAADIFHALDNRFRYSRALTNAAICYTFMGELEEAAALYKLFLPKPDTELSMHDADLVLNFGLFLIFKGEYEASIEQFERALEVQTRVNHKANMAKLHMNISEPLNALGRIWEAHLRVQEALRLINETSTDGNRDEMERALSISYIALGNHAKARQMIEVAIANAERYGNTYVIASGSADLALINLREGRVSEAMALVNPAVEIARESERMRLVGLALYVKGQCLFHAGQFEEAIETFAESADILRETAQGQRLWLSPYAQMALVHSLQNQPDLALPIVDEILAVIDGAFFYDAEEPEKLLLTCYKVLLAAEGARADDLLQLAKRQIDHVSAEILNPHERRNFRDIPHNREILNL